MATKEKEKTTVPAKSGNGEPTDKTTTVVNPLALYKRDVVDAVAAKVHQYIQNGEMNLPTNYSPNNALKSAWLILQNTVDKDKKPALTICTRNSVANSLLDMIVQGLNPGKKQGYFIVYGNTLVFQRSYFGAMAVAQMVNPDIGDFAYAVVYQGDKFKYGIEKGKKVIHTHEQDLENVDKKNIVAAYCIILDKKGDPMKTEIMTWDEIKQAWRQSKMNPIDDKGEIKTDSTHGKFTADMALKTVINKACKIIINASSDNTLLLERINRNEDLADAAAARVEIEENANLGEVLTIEAEAEQMPVESGVDESPPQSDEPTVEKTEEPKETPKKEEPDKKPERIPGF